MTASDHRAHLLNDPIESLVRRKAGGMLAGILGVMLFTLVDSIFIAMLGTQALAAMSYILPVTFIVTSLTMGLSVGISAIVSRMLGAEEWLQARRFVTDSLLLGTLIMAAVSLLGWHSVDAIFSLLGADKTTLPYIVNYMQIWFLGILLLAFPMLGNAAIRASGNMRTPATVMIIAGVINAILDPIFIFWLDLGIQGAAMASVISWLLTFSVAFYLLQVKIKLIDWRWPGLPALLNNWLKMLTISLPAALSQMLNPLAQAILVWLLSAYGIASVAAFGVGVRIESTLLIGAMALSATLPTVFGQNYGAQQYQRAAASVRYSIQLTIRMYLVAYLLLWPLAPYIASWFSDQQEVLDLATLYLRTVPLSYAMLSLSMLAASLLTALHKPVHSLLINAIRLFALTIPAALIGGALGATAGIFWAITLVQIAIGLGLYLYLGHLLQQIESEDKIEDKPLLTSYANSIANS